MRNEHKTAFTLIHTNPQQQQQTHEFRLLLRPRKVTVRKKDKTRQGTKRKEKV